MPKPLQRIMHYLRRHGIVRPRDIEAIGLPREYLLRLEGRSFDLDGDFIVSAGFAPGVACGMQPPPVSAVFEGGPPN